MPTLVLGSAYTRVELQSLDRPKVRFGRADTRLIATGAPLEASAERHFFSMDSSETISESQCFSDFEDR